MGARLCLAIACLPGCQVVFPREDSLTRPADCGPISMVTDNFDDGTVAPWINLRSTTFKVTNGELEDMLPISGLADARMDPFLDLTGGRFTVELTASPVVAGDISRLMLESLDGAPPFTIQVDGSMLQVGTMSSDGMFIKQAETSYDKTRHAIWRVSNQEGVTTLEAGPGDGTFEPLLPITTEVSWIRPHLVARTTGGFRAAFDNVDGGTGGHACPAASITNDFTSLESWGRRDSRFGTCGISVTSSAIELAPQVADNSKGYDCSVGPTTFYDLIDQSVELALDVHGGDLADTEIRFEVQSTNDERAGVRIVVDGNLDAQLEPYSELGQTLTPGTRVPYTSTMSRLRVTGSKVGQTEFLQFEISDGSSYTTVLNTGLVHGLDRAVISIRAIGPMVTGDPTTMRLTDAIGGR